MIRRHFLVNGITLGIIATAGCSSGLTGGSDNAESDLTQLEVDLEFNVQGSDLVVYHNGGDPIPAGETVYVTIEGDIQNEIQLGSDVHAGAEIIRVNGANNDFTGGVIVGLYFDAGDQPIEIGTGEARFSSPPQFSAGFSYDEDENSVSIRHRGGSAVDARSLIVVGDADNTPIEPSADSHQFRVGDTIFSHEDIRGVESGDEIRLVWVSGEKSVVIVSFEAP